MPFNFVGTSQFQIALIFLGFKRISFPAIIIYPRYQTSFIIKSYLLRSKFKPAFYNYRKTSLMRPIQSTFNPLIQIKILLRQVVIKSLNIFPKALLIYFQKIIRALIRLNSIISHSNSLNRIQNIIKYLSPSIIYIL